MDGPGRILTVHVDPAVRVLRAAHREDVVGAVIVVQGQADLLQVVGALGPPSGLAGGLDGGQEQADQDRDDRDHDE
jgi:hypothetical protein